MLLNKQLTAKVLHKAMSLANSFKWSYLQYPVFAAIVLFDIIYIQFPPLWCRIVLISLLVASPLIPYIRRFTVPAMAIFTWLITFYAVQFIPDDIKPQHIFINILPTLERIIYGANLSELISKHTNPVLDIFAWLPYGIIHFAFPFAFALALFVFGPPGTLPVFGKAFGYMNLAGVLTQLMFPTSPPWYELSYGSAPADYSVHGQPGGLARIDDILGLNLYGTTFGNSPLVFGAFPSLHSGCATIEMLFLSWLCPRLIPYCIFHVMWMWFATMYLTHHYLIDLVGGSIYATLAFFSFHHCLPAFRSGATTRLDYINSKTPVKNTIGNFIRSIEMERFISTLDMHEKNDSEAATALLGTSMEENDSINSYSEDEEDISVVTKFLESEEEEDSTNLYEHISLHAINPKIELRTVSFLSGYSSLPSTSTSPTCSSSSSPVTPSPSYSEFFDREPKP